MEILASHYGAIMFLVLAFGLFMAWGIGANDVANAMGTSAGEAPQVGLAQMAGVVDLNLVKQIVSSWLVTLPIAAVLAIAYFYTLKAIFI